LAATLRRLFAKAVQHYRLTASEQEEVFNLLGRSLEKIERAADQCEQKIKER
jgi:hypothetical protein